LRENDSAEKSKALRDRAEAFLKESPSTIKKVPPQDTKNLIEDLQLHQIELEMQNEELRRSQLELHAARDKYVDLYDFAPVGYFTLSEKGVIQEANLTGAAMLGVERGKLTGQPFSRFITQDTQDIFYLHRKKLIETRTRQSCELRLAKKDALELWVQLECVPIEDGEGNMDRFRVAVSNIEERKKAEEKYRSMMESIEDPMYICSPDFHVEYMNPAMVKRMGYDAIGEPCYKVIHELDEKCPWCVHDKMQQGKNCVIEIVSPKDNRTYNVSNSPIHHVDGSISKLSIYRDITEIRNMEQHLGQVQKMEAIAILAGGVAHEFNNALMGIMGNIELLKMNLPENERRDKSFAAMNESGHRMSRLTDQLLAYARGGKYQPEDLKLDDFTIGTLPILQHDLNPEVRVETHFPKDISYIRADHTQMQMVLSAIVANSNEAIEDEGLIRITAENKNVDEDFTKQHAGLKPGPYVCLTIEDDGKGMDEETRSRIFEPFFTTKFQGRGMGMAAVYGIIKGHDGAITVDSEPGKGTVVRIYLPAIEAREEVRKEVDPGPTVELATGEGTILVIEDEEPLVEMFKQILEKHGYRVLVAETGKEAVELAKTFDGRIDLALLDIKLPDMEGGRVYPLIMEARPDLKVIVCSGYSIHGPAQDIIDAGAEGFIQKPFSIPLFAEKLKGVLEGK